MKLQRLGARQKSVYICTVLFPQKLMPDYGDKNHFRSVPERSSRGVGLVHSPVASYRPAIGNQRQRPNRSKECIVYKLYHASCIACSTESITSHLFGQYWSCSLSTCLVTGFRFDTLLLPTTMLLWRNLPLLRMTMDKLTISMTHWIQTTTTRTCNLTEALAEASKQTLLNKLSSSTTTHSTHPVLKGLSSM